jgi:CHAT domain-containing protein/tetratricopeptide (TPR) repeat protein
MLSSVPVTTSQVDPVQTVVAEILELKSVDAFRDLLRRDPTLKSRRTLEWLGRVAQDPYFGSAFASVRQLLQEAAVDDEAAWSAYDARRARANQEGEEAQRLEELARAALDQGQFDQALSFIDEALPLAISAGLGLTVSGMEEIKGQALFRSQHPERAQRVEASIDCFNRALPLAPDSNRRAGVLMHLGLALGERVLGDHADNLEASVEAIQAALAELTDSSPPALWAIVRTNLAWALLRRERGDPSADLLRAERLCLEALEYRSPQVDPVDWAHTQLNLGEIRARLLPIGLGRLEQVEETYGAVIDAAPLLDARLVATAEWMVGRTQRSHAHRTPQQIVDLHEQGGEIEMVDAALLSSAYDHLKEAARLSPAEPHLPNRGRILSEFSAAAQDRGLDEEAIHVARQAFDLLTPETDLRGCVSVGFRLGSLLSQRGDFDEAAPVFRTAVHAADLAFFSRLGTEGRESDIRAAGNLYRWAAFALAKAGYAQEAAVVLETGSARELRRRVAGLSLSKSLTGVPPEARDDFERAASALATAPLGAGSADAARRFQEEIQAIRALPGMASFAAAPTSADILGATERGWPLLYLDPTPFGTLVVVVLDEPDAPIFEATFFETTSTQIVNYLAVGAASETEAEPTGSYIMGIGAAGNAEVQDQLDEVLSWIGHRIMEPLANLPAVQHAEGLTLIPYGPFANVPLHAATIQDSSALIGILPVRYAPSGVLAAISLERASEPTSSTAGFVALADPFGDLLGAGPEAKYIGAQFFSETHVGSGSDATGEFLTRHAPNASHLHLACHAYGGLFDENETALLLADGPVSLTALSQLKLSCRVCVASACQTALSSLTALPQEGLSLATVLLAAGSSCAIASLWPVDDGATTVLMILLYDRIIRDALRPPEALREAELALSRLTLRELLGLVTDYPEIRPALRLGGHLPAEIVDPAKTPFNDPFFWAGFIAVGA